MSLTLNDETKRQLIESRLAAFALDAYSHQLNLQIAIETGDEKSRLSSEEAISMIESASAVYKIELETIPIIEPATIPIIELAATPVIEE